MPKNQLAYTPTEVAGFIPATFTGSVYKPTTQYAHQDYDLLARSIEAKQARIDKAVEQQSAIDESLAGLEAQLNNNEETRTWFQSYKDNIQNQIKTDIDAGNYRKAIRKASGLAKGILLDPEVQGRIATNKQYQSIKEEQRKAAGNNQELFEYWLANNQYNHENITDESGKVISYKDYTPNFTLLPEANLTGLASAAFKLITPDKKANSNTTDYTSNSYSRETITEQQIKDNLGAILADSGTSLAQIEQKQNYETYLMTKDKQKLDEINLQLTQLQNQNQLNPDIIARQNRLKEEKVLYEQKVNKRQNSLTRNGALISPEDYAVSILSPIIKNMAYDYKQTHNTTKTPTPTNPTNPISDWDASSGYNETKNQDNVQGKSVIMKYQDKTNNTWSFRTGHDWRNS